MAATTHDGQTPTTSNFQPVNLRVVVSDANQGSDGINRPSIWVRLVRFLTAMNFWSTRTAGGDMRHEVVEDSFIQRLGLNNSNLTEKDPEVNNKKRHSKIRDKFKKVLKQSETRYYIWLCVMGLPILYNFILIIARSVFSDLQTQYMIAWFCLDYTCDLLYLCDIVVSFRTGFLEHGLLVTDAKKLIQNQMKSWTFKLDVLSILPLDVLYITLGTNATYLRLNRLLKLPRLIELYSRSLLRSKHPNFINILNISFYFLIAVHWYGCLYFALSNYLGFGSDSWVYPNVTSPQYSRLQTKYIYSFYFSSMILTTIGNTPFPVTPFEKVFTLSSFLFGVLAFSYVVGTIGSIVEGMNKERDEFQQNVDGVKRYMAYRKVDKFLGKRVVQWFDYLWDNRTTLDVVDALATLPDKLRAEIAINVHMATLKRVMIFQDCEPGLLVELVLKLRQQVYSPGDYICRRGDIGREMYIVKRGKLNVVDDSGTKVFATLSDGSVFGELSILNIEGNKTGNRRTANVMSMGYSDLFVLSKKDLWDALQEYPEAKERLIEKGRQILLKDKLIDEEALLAKREIESIRKARIKQLEVNIDVMATRIARLMAEIAATESKLDSRMDEVELKQTRLPYKQTDTPSDMHDF